MVCCFTTRSFKCCTLKSLNEGILGMSDVLAEKHVSQKKSASLLSWTVASLPTCVPLVSSVPLPRAVAALRCFNGHQKNKQMCCRHRHNADAGRVSRALQMMTVLQHNWHPCGKRRGECELLLLTVAAKCLNPVPSHCWVESGCLTCIGNMWLTTNSCDSSGTISKKRGKNAQKLVTWKDHVS